MTRLQRFNAASSTLIRMMVDDRVPFTRTMATVGVPPHDLLKVWTQVVIAAIILSYGKDREHEAIADIAEAVSLIREKK